MSGGHEGTDAAPSIYEKFKENTHKIFVDENFKESLDKANQMLREKQASHRHPSRSDATGQVCVCILAGPIHLP